MNRGGVRPSSGAAVCAGLPAPDSSNASANLFVAAPGDGRAPVQGFNARKFYWGSLPDRVQGEELCISTHHPRDDMNRRNRADARTDDLGMVLKGISEVRRASVLCMTPD
jgi:hypothetical protein